MNYVIKLVAQYQSTESEYIFELLITEFKNLINHYNKKTTKFYKEDLYQELIYRLFRVIKSFKFKSLKKIDKSLFNKHILRNLEKNKFKNINLIFENEYLYGFIDKYGEELFKSACLNNNNIDNFLNEFELFSNENQFYEYLDKSLNREVAYFYRKYHIKENDDLISLNSLVSDGIELIEIIPDDRISDNKIFDKESLLSEEDKMFLSHFYDGKRIYSGKEVAKKLSVTQQAVSSKLKRVRKRYLKKFKELYVKIEK